MTSPLLHITLALSVAAPSEEAAREAFNTGRYAEARDLYLERAQDPGVHRPDAYYGARDSLLALYDATGDIGYLCRALGLSRELLADNLHFVDASERQAWVEAETEDRAREARHGKKCREIELATKQEISRAKPAQAKLPEPPLDPVAPRPQQRNRRLSSYMAFGVGSSVLSGGLMVGAISTLIVRERSDNIIHATGTEAWSENRELTSAERRLVAAADRRYLRQTTSAVLHGVGAAVCLIAGVVLLSLYRHNQRQARLRMAPWALTIRF